jgi:hypothetical protein
MLVIPKAPPWRGFFYLEFLSDLPPLKATRHGMSRSALRMRLGRPDDARAIGVLIRRVVRRWVVPDQPHDAAMALLERLGAQVLRER